MQGGIAFADPAASALERGEFITALYPGAASAIAATPATPSAASPIG